VTSEALVRLFVYGSLKPGASDYWRIAADVRVSQPATIAGRLIARGDYPGLVEGAGRVPGVVLTLTAGALAAADEWEDYVPGREKNLYERRIAEVILSDGSATQAWAYFAR
jgi:gamma-glutamylcyclotransferase (GGCT)/AIG2-like uncharacterized protein YtfP